MRHISANFKNYKSLWLCPNTCTFQVFSILHWNWKIKRGRMVKSWFTLLASTADNIYWRNNWLKLSSKTDHLDIANREIHFCCFSIEFKLVIKMFCLNVSEKENVLKMRWRRENGKNLVDITYIDNWKLLLKKRVDFGGIKAFQRRNLKEL